MRKEAKQGKATNPSSPEEGTADKLAASLSGFRFNEGDNNKVTTVMASDRTGANVELSYTATKIIGNGSFGVVFQAKLVQSGETVAIKKVLQDKRFKNRELDIMRLVSHPNVVQLSYFFYGKGEKPDEVYLNLVLEFIPETIHRGARHYAKLKQQMPMIQVKLYMYQLFRSLAYIHFMGICHRDIKPQNLLLDPVSGILKLCDFGSAKILIAGEQNVAYICSRYYRAPELIFGATLYSTAIDIWSTGCVMAELLTGHPLFPGESGVDQLVEIIKVMGTPTRQQVHAMNPNYNEFKFPQIKAQPWAKVLFRGRTHNGEAIELMTHLLEYVPHLRYSPMEALAHPFFDELRDPNARLPSGQPLPPLFNFTEQELSLRPDLNRIIVPSHAEAALRARLPLDNYLRPGPPPARPVINAETIATISASNSISAQSGPIPQHAPAPGGN